jgi:LPXTG-motif cell wall-anchored protein
MSKNIKILISISLAVVMGLITQVTTAYADCESTYGGGETCVYNKRFEIEKKVRIEGEDDWEDKVTDVSKNDIIEFRVRIKNRSDEESADYIDFDNMKMKDILPDELTLVDDGGLTEEWDNFEPGETKEFIIRAKIVSEEWNRDDNFEKCVVNKAEVYWDKKFEGADTATVCYGQGTPTELPKTGFGSTFVVLGSAFMGLGAIVSKTRKYVK